MGSQNSVIRVAALTSGRDVPSARFRIRQHISSLAKHNVEVAEYCPVINQHARLPGKLGRIRSRYLPPVLLAQTAVNTLARLPGVFGTFSSDLVWLERSFLPGLEIVVRLTKAPRVLDVDDAVWLMNPLGENSAKLLARSVDAVIAGNDYLADWYSRFCQNVYVVPTAIDCQRFTPGERIGKDRNNLFVIGWTGTSGNFKYLKSIEKPLARFLKARREARLLIVADKKPSFELIPEFQVWFERWTPQSESDVLRRMDVGIMPLLDDDWGRGKCSFKMLQYMASGLPVIVSNVGMNKEVLGKGACGFGPRSDDEWYELIEQLYREPHLRLSLGQNGRRIAEKNYSLEVVSDDLTRIFNELV